jgi:hypothetical protein
VLLGDREVGEDRREGSLLPGDFEVSYTSPQGEKISRPLNVAVSSAKTIDEVPYAMVTNVEATDILHVGDPIQFVLRGKLNSLCTELPQAVETHSYKDVIVVRRS